MSGQIIESNQVESLQKIIIPSGVGIATNSSPSLAPTNFSLATDVSQAGNLYVGNGSSWLPVSGSGGFQAGSSAKVTGISLTLGGQPTISGVSAYFFSESLGTSSSNNTRVSVVINYAGSAVTVTGAGEYTSGAVVPNAYIPVTQPFHAPCIIRSSAASPQYTQSYMSIDQTGHIIIYNPATSGTITFDEISATYTLTN